MSRTSNLFDEQSTPAEPHPVLELLLNTDAENLTPLEAIIKLQEFRKLALQD